MKASYVVKKEDAEFKQYVVTYEGKVLKDVVAILRKVEYD